MSEPNARWKYEKVWIFEKEPSETGTFPAYSQGTYLRGILHWYTVRMIPAKNGPVFCNTTAVFWWFLRKFAFKSWFSAIYHRNILQNKQCKCIIIPFKKRSAREGTFLEHLIHLFRRISHMALKNAYLIDLMSRVEKRNHRRPTRVPKNDTRIEKKWIRPRYRPQARPIQPRQIRLGILQARA